LNGTRALAALILALGLALGLLACGGDDGGDEDPQQLLSETFSTPIQSGTFDLDFRIEASGGEEEGDFEAKLGGPFQGRGEAFPEFDLDVSVKAESGSQSISGTGGVTSTSDKAFINFQGTDYAVDQEIFDQYVSTFTSLQDRGDTGEQGLLETLGINPSAWLTDLENDGTEEIQGAEAIHISGKADIPKFIEDLQALAKSAGSAAGEVKPEELDQLDETIESADFDVFTGADDKILRRLEGSLELVPSEDAPGGFDSLSVDFQLNLGAVNEPQTIETPSASQPFSALLQRLNIDPGRIGESLRGGLQGAGALPETGGSTTAPSGDAVQAYQSCLSEAQGQAELQECAELLGE
jgi:hypothetical protein